MIALRLHIAFRLRSARVGLRVCRRIGCRDIEAMYRAEINVLRGICSVLRRQQLP